MILEAAHSRTAMIASETPAIEGCSAPALQGSSNSTIIRNWRGSFRAHDDTGLLAPLRAQTVARADLFEPAEDQPCLVNPIHSALETHHERTK